MLLYFTDAINNKSVAVNPDHIIAVFVGPENTELAGKTIINIPSGTLAVVEEFMGVVGRINGELK
jgi:hypothetical protein